jgi:hypothetical protein
VAERIDRDMHLRFLAPLGPVVTRTRIRHVARLLTRLLYPHLSTLGITPTKEKSIRWFKVHNSLCEYHHKVFDLASRRGVAGFEVALNA